MKHSHRYTWMDLENIMHSKRSQVPRATCCMIPLTGNVQSRESHRARKQIGGCRLGPGVTASGGGAVTDMIKTGCGDGCTTLRLRYKHGAVHFVCANESSLSTPVTDTVGGDRKGRRSLSRPLRALAAPRGQDTLLFLFHSHKCPWCGVLWRCPWRGPSKTHFGEEATSPGLSGGRSFACLLCPDLSPSTHPRAPP